MTKAEFLARCETIYDSGLATKENFHLMARWLDALMRYEHSVFSDGQSQMRSWLEFLDMEDERTERGRYTLASDKAGYALQKIAAILDHPCQQCAENPNAWHTRPGFCEHRGIG